MERQLYLRLEPSKILRTYLLGLFLLCGCAIALCGLAGWLKFVLASVTAAGFWRKDRSLQYPSIVGVRVVEGEWQLETATGFHLVALQANPVVTYSITVLHFVCANGVYQSMVLLPDSCGAEQMRQLRVLLLRGQDSGTATGKPVSPMPE